MFWDNFTIDDRSGPKYLAICDALADAIHHGRLHRGRKLPSHRMLATKLGVSVGTVTRAYEEALDRGLITGEVGRGTFVSHHPPPPFRVVGESRFPGIRMDLYQNFPVAVPELEHRSWAEALDLLRRESDLAALSRSSWSEVTRRNQQAGAAWIGRTRFRPPARTILDCPGVMSAVCAILGATTEPGDRILAASLTHPGIRSLADQYGLKIVGLPIDEDGLEPEGFEAACREHAPRLLYCAPTIHSPTTSTLPEDRRRAVAEIAERHDVLVVEDESAGFLLPDPPLPIAAHAPRSSFFIGDVWMALSLGLRTTYLAVPEPLLEITAAAVAATSGTTAPLIAAVAASWIESGTADDLIEQRREELNARNTLAVEIMGRRHLRSQPCGHHLWLRLPEPWRSDRFVLRAERLGIAIAGAEWFHVGHNPIPEAVRICIGNAPDRESLRWALEQLDRAIDDPTSGTRPAL